jgi:hypothetical protein
MYLDNSGHWRQGAGALDCWWDGEPEARDFLDKLKRKRVSNGKVSE